VARTGRRHQANVPGPWFVDDTCINCDASRQCAPQIFGEVDGQSVVVHQPVTGEEVRAAARAMLACPTASIGTTGDKPDVHGLFPEELEGGVFYVGYCSPKSYGANSFLAVRPEGSFLVDAPRWVPSLLPHLVGVTDIFLTHQDDVADAGRYAEHLGARVWIHEADRRAAPFATEIVRGTEAVQVRPGLQIIPVPGHTRGSIAILLEERFLFTGDSLHASRTHDRLSAFPDVCWYSWEEQARSLERLMAHRFEWVLAGHGDRRRATVERNHAELAALVGRMRGDPSSDGDW
jgi:glyoxylase-like metal-dependent hydrolase (beta-lactamase superfamily II)